MTTQIRLRLFNPQLKKTLSHVFWETGFHVQTLCIFSFLSLFLHWTFAGNLPRKTTVAIRNDKFYINGTPTWKGKTWHGYSIEGLLPNSRMVQGVFDDLNPGTKSLWFYPDTKQWDADRNTNEFVASMTEWYSHGLLSFTLNLQGGSPMGYGNKNWINSAYYEDGRLRPEYFRRLERILDKADELGMVPILGLFYFGQDQYLKDETAVITAVDHVITWLFHKGYKNILLEVDNECNAESYDHEILKPARVNELLVRIRKRMVAGYRFYVSTSFTGDHVPTSQVIKTSDFILLHGNGVKEPARIKQMVEETKNVVGYSPKPILFNEDDHYDFEKSVNNFTEATKVHASWGFFDYRRAGENFNEGYQCPPVDWGIHSERKKGFFELLKAITGGNNAYKQ
jgi:hypothetical protein